MAARDYGGAVSGGYAMPWRGLNGQRVFSTKKRRSQFLGRMGLPPVTPTRVSAPMPPVFGWLLCTAGRSPHRRIQRRRSPGPVPVPGGACLARYGAWGTGLGGASCSHRDRNPEQGPRAAAQAPQRKFLPRFFVEKKKGSPCILRTGCSSAMLAWLLISAKLCRNP